eukprot:TRINITY_DN17751_c0_g1_i1.p1 TRINITY_DN17751_c0_g1~~TRINITY_DN17751_c0_g1_i1.p1  ORF type:complete len:365 (-),score=77.10 TRINITY_DN17751_c0_g1_i1:78-1172(-)
MTQVSTQNNGDVAVATVGCGAIGLVFGGPVGAVVGGCVGMALGRRAARQTSEEAVARAFQIASIRLEPAAIVERAGVTYFGIDVFPANGGTPWRVLRRYNDFHAMQRRVRVRHAFPPKHMTGCRGPRLEERRRELEGWLRTAVAQTQAQPLRFHGRDVVALHAFLTQNLQSLPMAAAAPIGASPAAIAATSAPAALPAAPVAASAVPMTAPVAPLPPPTETTPSGAGAQAGPQEGGHSEPVMLTIPVPCGMAAGQPLDVQVPGGRQLRISLPEGYGTELRLRFDPKAGTLTPEPLQSDGHLAAEAHEEELLLSVPVPADAAPHQSLSVVVPDGRQLTVSLPAGAVRGSTQLLRFNSRAGTLVPA